MVIKKNEQEIAKNINLLDILFNTKKRKDTYKKEKRETIIINKLFKKISL